MGGLPRVSVVVAAYNMKQTVGDCLDSLLAQSYPKDQVELIVVDNASTDGTSRVLQAYEGRVRILHELKRGPAAARNAGLAAAQGDLVAFIDADCVADEEWLRNIVRQLDDPSVGIAGGTIHAARPCNWVERFGEAIHDHRQSIEVFRPPYVISMNWCSRLAVLRRLNFFDERFQRTEDVDLSYRVVQAGYSLVFQPDAIVWHRNVRTLPALFKKGFQHGYYSVQAGKRHAAFLSATLGHRRRVNGRAYVAIGSHPLDSARGAERAMSLCHAVFDSGKKIGKACGSVRFRHVDL
ncbi:MAG: glycosyltransferase [Actinomycetota bacterium]|nr:glycosyltransferase [Actinomycetota bacterium]